MKKISLPIIGFFLATSVFGISAALAISDVVVTPDNGTFASSQLFNVYAEFDDINEPPLGNWCNDWGVTDIGPVQVSDQMGYGNGNIFGSQGSFLCLGDSVDFQLPEGAYTTLWLNCDSGGGMCLPGNFSNQLAVDITVADQDPSQVFWSQSQTTEGYSGFQNGLAMLGTVFTALFAIMGGLLGIGFGIRKVKEKITGKKF